jgi:hypothetical protein
MVTSAAPSLRDDIRIRMPASVHARRSGDACRGRGSVDCRSGGGIRSGLTSVRGDMAPPELVSLIVAVVAWIVLLGSLTPDA